MFLLFAQAASAFCGNYVGEAGAELINSASEVAIVRQGDHTTITMASDFEADVDEFAVVIPVPVVLEEQDVRVVDPSLFDTLDGYSGPRLVEYSCDELYPEQPRTGPGCYAEYAMSADDAGYASDTYSDVEVENRFIVGEYEIVILSAEESDSLIGWLNDNGYATSITAEDMMQEYLDGGSFFFAARVDTELIPEGQDMLSPLQFRYRSEVFSLPIRLGTVNSPGEQDLVIYALTDADEGRVGIANYDEATVEDECLFRTDEEDFGDFYEDRFTDGVGGEPQWVTEYGWYVTPWVSACDPCPPTEIAEPMDVNDLKALGFLHESLEYGEASYYFTRLRMRYTPQQATEDLTLYISGITENTQQRYISYASYLESLYPICVEGWSDDPGSCADEGWEYRRRMRQEERGCTAVQPWDRTAGLALLLAGLIGLARLRRDA